MSSVTSVSGTNSGAAYPHTVKSGNAVFRFDEKGVLRRIEADGAEWPMAGIVPDIGCNGRYAGGALEWSTFEDFRTWDLPPVRPTGRLPEQTPAVSAGDNALTAAYDMDGIRVEVRYAAPVAGALAVSARMTNTTAAPAELNGFALLTVFDLEGGDAAFEYPANVPCRVSDTAALGEYEVVTAGLVNAATHIRMPAGAFNLVFIDEIEKWSCGVYKAGGKLYSAYVPSLEMMLEPGATADIGTLYLLPAAGAACPYTQIRDFYAALGYRKAEDGITDGVMYSGHPAGTMDKNFPLKDDLYKYAEYLPKLREMGVDHVWLLPIFDHQDRGVYHSTDQAVIDERYGGDDAVRHYINKAHELGMTVLFDYVPHGPAATDPLGLRTREWCSRRKDGELHEEWDCVSYDYNNPGYQQYTTDLVADHVRRFSVDGARIDCAMGGLSNWRPLPGERPSGNSVRAGVNITRATRDGFLQEGKRSFILPENFYPLPQYFAYTDIYYGMSLYRVFVELEDTLRSDPAAFVADMTHWLEAEKKSLPEGYCKLRFLGNHDTVAWVWQASRAVPLYGLDRAKALWAFIAFLDGMPMIYQGDEDPAIYFGDGPKLDGFFSEIFHARKTYFSDNVGIEYLDTQSAVMAFKRPGGADGERLVLINFSGGPAVYNAGRPVKPLLGHAAADGDAVTLPPFAYDICAL